MRVQADVDINGVLQHTFDPGCLEGRGVCVKFCSEERADRLVATNPKLLRKFRTSTARSLLAKGRQMGDFFEAWESLFGPIPQQSDFVKAQEAEERAKLVTRLRGHGIHDVVKLSLQDLRRYAADPSSYWDDKVQEMNLDDSDGEPVTITQAAPNPADGVNALRQALRQHGVRIPKDADMEWMNNKLTEVQAATAEALGIAGADHE